MESWRDQVESLFEEIEHEASFACSHALPPDRLKFECLVRIQEYVDQLWRLMEDIDEDYEEED